MSKENIIWTTGLIACFLLSLPTSAQEKKAAQRDKADTYRSYKNKSTSQDEGTLLREARELKESDPAEALNKVKEALAISLAQQDVVNEGKCYLLLGEINESIEEWKLALDNYTNAYQKLKPDYNNSSEFKSALRGLANTHLKLGNHEQALQLFQEGFAFRGLGNAEKTSMQLGISEVYFQMEDYPQALKAVESISTPKARETGDEATDAGVQNQKAKIYARMNDPGKAKDAFLSSQNALRTVRGAPQAAQPHPEEDLKKQDDDLKEAKEEVAGALHEQQRFDEEIDLRNQAIEFNLESNNLPEVTKDKVGIGNALAAKGETSEAIREFEEAAIMADTINDPKEQANAFLALADLYEKNGRDGKALSTYKRYSQAVKKAEAQDETRLTEKSELIQKQKDIESLSQDVAIGQREDAIEQATVFRQQLVIYGLLLIIVIIAITSWFIYKNAQASKVANQLLALKSLRSQMNPHFIFNALNSVNHFVAQNDERTANKFLSEFSRLMRLVMENSQEDFIPLYKEQEIISLYLRLEHYRFRDKFDYEMKIDEDINLEAVEIPPMLLQPYIENAVWHGLRYKENKGHLSLHIRKNSHGLEAEITDNGIGRKRSAELKTENQKKQNSTGLKNIEERLRIINKVYKAHYTVSITDLQANAGTRVLITIPEHKQNGHS